MNSVKTISPLQPDSSFWVSASAGTGKTTLLTERVLRLLIEGVEPKKILCITFTKAAAAEMLERITSKLSSWIFIDDTALEEEIKKLGVSSNLAEVKNRCRSLFAEIIDKSESVRIQTIHAFCQSILGRFPLESGVRSSFKVIDERTSDELLKEARSRLLKNNNSKNLIESLGIIASETSDYSLDKIISSFIENFSSIHGYKADKEKIINEIYEFLSINKWQKSKDFIAKLSEELPEKDLLLKAAEILCSGSKTDAIRGNKIYKFLAEKNNASAKDYFSAFINADGGEAKKLLTKDLLKKHGWLLDFLLKEQARVIKISEKIKLHNIAELTAHLLNLCEAIFILYEDIKKTRALLDYNDLIVKTSEILQNQAIGPWIMFKLDGGIEHIFIDEAQDTSPRQWSIINSLLSEFFSGSGSKNSEKKTVFVVGDEKQSIYSFHGADHKYFSSVKNDFIRKSAEAGKILHEFSLKESRRSSEPVLKLVDEIFKDEKLKNLISLTTPEIMHGVTRTSAGGVFEIWPLFKKEKQEEIKFPVPGKRYENENNQKILAETIAVKIEEIIKNGRVLGRRSKTVSAGDIMVLVRKRGAFNKFLENALKEKNIHVAGADRQKLDENITFSDLLSLAQFIANPEDDLNLAALLKSPFFNFSEDELFDAAYQREESIFKSISKNKKFSHVTTELDKIINAAREKSLLPFYIFMLSENSGWKKIFARNGQKSQAVINEFLNLIEIYENSHTISYDGFVSWLKSGTSEVKNEMNINSDEVRIITVHGSKGLEAPVVFMVDSSDIPAAKNVISWVGKERNLPLWITSDNKNNQFIENIKNQQRQETYAEYMRLLYVALTRAEDEIYICGYEGRGINQNCWHSIAKNAAIGIAAEFKFGENETGYRLEKKNELLRENKIKEKKEFKLEEYFFQPVENQVGEKIYHPSYSSTDEVRIADSKALRRGNVLHKFFQNFARYEFEDNFNFVINSETSGFTKTEIGELRQVVEKVIKNKDFQKFFGENSRPEVAIAGVVDGKKIVGVIDRMVVTEKEILLLEIKSDRFVPNMPENIKPQYISQIYYYVKLLEKIYPGKTISPSLLWVSKPEFMRLNSDKLKPIA